MAQEKNKTVYPRTISIELLDAWRKFKRRSDGETIAEALGYSRPVIDRAINFGYVKTDGLTDAITNFFTARLDAEKASAAKLMSYSDTPTD